MLTLLATGDPAPATTCVNGGVTAWPPSNTTLPRNPRILLETDSDHGWGDGTTHELLRSIPRRRPYLWGPRGKVPLRVVETYQAAGWNGRDVLQVVLEPVARLEAGARYDLRMTSRRGPSPASTWATWRTSSTADLMAPTWLGAAAVSEADYFDQDGLGASFVLKTPVADEAGPVQVILEAQDAWSAAAPRLRWRTPLRGHEIHIWSGSCGGIIQPTIYKRYRLKLTAVDAAGNESPWRAGSDTVEGILALSVPPPPPVISVELPATHPKIVRRVEPRYPLIAARAGVTGKVDLDVILNADGTVKDVKVGRSSSPMLDAAAVEAIRGWVFQAATQEGERLISLTVTFKMAWAEPVWAVP